jgi:hypothetical protein
VEKGKMEAGDRPIAVRGFDGEPYVIFYEFFLELAIRHNPISFGGEPYVISYEFF